MCDELHLTASLKRSQALLNILQDYEEHHAEIITKFVDAVKHVRPRLMCHCHWLYHHLHPHLHPYSHPHRPSQREMALCQLKKEKQKRELTKNTFEKAVAMELEEEAKREATRKVWKEVLSGSGGNQTRPRHLRHRKSAFGMKSDMGNAVMAFRDGSRGLSGSVPPSPSRARTHRSQSVAVMTMSPTVQSLLPLPPLGAIANKTKPKVMEPVLLDTAEELQKTVHMGENTLIAPSQATVHMHKTRKQLEEALISISAV